MIVWTNKLVGHERSFLGVRASGANSVNACQNSVDGCLGFKLEWLGAIVCGIGLFMFVNDPEHAERKSSLELLSEVQISQELAFFDIVNYANSLCFWVKGFGKK